MPYAIKCRTAGVSAHLKRATIKYVLGMPTGLGFRSTFLYRKNYYVKNQCVTWPQILCTGFWGLPVWGFSRLYSLILLNSCLALMPSL